MHPSPQTLPLPTSPCKYNPGKGTELCFHSHLPEETEHLGHYGNLFSLQRCTDKGRAAQPRCGREGEGFTTKGNSVTGNQAERML